MRAVPTRRQLDAVDTAPPTLAKQQPNPSRQLATGRYGSTDAGQAAPAEPKQPARHRQKIILFAGDAFVEPGTANVTPLSWIDNDPSLTPAARVLDLGHGGPGPTMSAHNPSQPAQHTHLRAHTAMQTARPPTKLGAKTADLGHPPAQAHAPPLTVHAKAANDQGGHGGPGPIMSTGDPGRP